MYVQNMYVPFSSRLRDENNPINVHADVNVADRHCKCQHM